MSDHYTVLARRFRPQTFSDVVGQEHVGRAIQNAIKSGRVAHAYLFTGARGVGKTSTARIFAKALNCPNVADGVPCNSCEACVAISEGTDVDVLEIDGASNRGIDDIRQLRANVNIRSMRSPYKVYIIDEVHMLTKEAFNALLKTLEEPPPTVKFIFCTTEPQKVPDTILSRCQRFDFGTITSSRIGDRLSEIAQAEGIAVDDEAIEMVARRASGSMRDSQSLFDQLLAFGGEQITAEDVHRLFGTAPDERIVALMDAIVSRNRAVALTMVDESLDSGVRLDSLADQLIAYLRDLLVLAAGASTVPLSAVSDRLRDALAEQANQMGLRTVTAGLQIVSDAKQKMSRTVHGRPLLELAVVRLTLLEDLDNLAALVQAARAGELAGPISAGSVKKKRLDEPNSLTASGAPASNQRAEAPPVVSHEQNGHAPTAIVEPRVPQTVEPSDTSQYAEEDAQRISPAGSPPSASPQMALSAETFDEFWARLLKLVPERLAAILGEAKNTVFRENGEIAVTVATAFALEFVSNPRFKKRLDTLTEGMVGRTVPFVFDLAQTGPPTTIVRERQSEPQMRKKSTVDDDPFVQSAIELFGGQLIQVKSIPAAAVTVDREPDLNEDDIENLEEDE